MSLKDDIKSKVKEYLSPGRYTTTNIDYIPDKTDPSITFGNKGSILSGTALHIDLRNSTMIMKKHHKDTIAKIHKAYLHIVAKIVSSHNGCIRSFNGDGVLVFFPGNTVGTIKNAVMSAMKIAHLLTVECKSNFEQYDALDFGIGIHHGEMLVVKTGLAGDNNNDLLWIGDPVNFAVKMGDMACSPKHIRISYIVHNNLADDMRYHIIKKQGLFGEEIVEKVDMWNPVYAFQYADENVTIYETSYLMTVS